MKIVGVSLMLGGKEKRRVCCWFLLETLILGSSWFCCVAWDIDGPLNLGAGDSRRLFGGMGYPGTVSGQLRWRGSR